MRDGFEFKSNEFRNRGQGIINELRDALILALLIFEDVRIFVKLFRRKFGEVLESMLLFIDELKDAKLQICGV